MRPLHDQLFQVEPATRQSSAVERRSRASKIYMDPFSPISGPVSEKNASRAIVDTSVERVTGLDFRQTEEFLAVEEPLEIQLAYGSADARAMKSISVTMRTPAHDFELAAGCLMTE